MSNVPQAVLVREYGTPDRFDLCDMDPGAPSAGEVRVAVHAAGVSYVDLLVAMGQYQLKPALPAIPGSEFSGIVEAVGKDVDSARIGQRVMVSAFGGAFCEAANVQAKAAIAIPDEMSLEEAAIFKISYSTAYYALVQRGSLKTGETLLVLGAGGAIGYAATEIGKALGARVIGSVSDTRRELALRAGADATVDSRSVSWRDDVKAANGGEPVDVVLDPVGGNSTEPAFRSLAWNGRHLVIGFVAGSIPKIPANLALLKGAALIGVDVRQFGEREPDVAAKNVEALFSLYREGQLHPPIGRRYPLAQFAEAMDEAFQGSGTGRIVLTMRGR